LWQKISCNFQILTGKWKNKIMLSRIVQIILIIVSVFFLFGIVYFFFIASPEHFILNIRGKHIDFRLIGAAFCILMIFQNIVLLALLRIDILGRYSIKLKIDSEALLQADETFPVTAHIQENVEVPIDEILDIEVPVKQDAEIIIREPLNIPLDVIVKVPIDDEVEVESTVPIETVIHLDTHLETSILGKMVKIPIQLDVPLEMEVPIRCKARVKKDDFSVHIRENLSIAVKDSVPVHMDTLLRTQFPFKKTLSIALEMKAHAKVQMDQAKPVKIKGEFILNRDSFKMGLVSKSR
jgi:hypothetical protein